MRATYRAMIHTDSGVLAVMSAENDPKAKHNGEYAFVMPQAIPSYLIALAVGDLEFKETGPRTGVYAEKSVVKRGREGIRRHRGDDRGRREVVRAVPLEPLRHPGAAAEFPGWAARRIRGCPSSRPR